MSTSQITTYDLALTGFTCAQGDFKNLMSKGYDLCVELITKPKPTMKDNMKIREGMVILHQAQHISL